MVLEGLNLFDFFVNQLGGNVLLGFLIILGILFMICMITKMSLEFQLCWYLLFILCYGMMFLGGFAGFIVGGYAAWYFFQSAYNFYTARNAM